MLMNGTSGYADFVTDDGFIAAFYADPFRHWTPEELIAIGARRGRWSAIRAPAGPMPTPTSSSSGKVLEKVGGQPLDGLIREASSIR